MPNTPPIRLPRDPLVPAEAHRAADLLSALANAEIKVVKASGDAGLYAFQFAGQTAWLVLPLASDTTLPALTGNVDPSAFGVEQDLTVSNPPTQAQVQAIVDYTREGFRHLRLLTDILRRQQFPS